MGSLARFLPEDYVREQYVSGEQNKNLIPSSVFKGVKVNISKDNRVLGRIPLVYLHENCAPEKFSVSYSIEPDVDVVCVRNRLRIISNKANQCNINARLAQLRNQNRTKLYDSNIQIYRFEKKIVYVKLSTIYGIIDNESNASRFCYKFSSPEEKIIANIHTSNKNKAIMLTSQGVRRFADIIKTKKQLPQFSDWIEKILLPKMEELSMN